MIFEASCYLQHACKGLTVKINLFLKITHFMNLTMDAKFLYIVNQAVHCPQLYICNILKYTALMLFCYQYKQVTIRNFRGCQN